MARQKKGLSEVESAELRGWEIPMPGTEIAKMRLYEFVKKGSKQWGQDEAARIEYAKAECQRWTGKRVRPKGGRVTETVGTVAYLVFRSRIGIETIRASMQAAATVSGQANTIGVGPYQVAVVWDGKTGPSMNSPMGLEFLPEQLLPASNS